MEAVADLVATSVRAVPTSDLSFKLLTYGSSKGPSSLGPSFLFFHKGVPGYEYSDYLFSMCP